MTGRTPNDPNKEATPIADKKDILCSEFDPIGRGGASSARNGLRNANSNAKLGQAIVAVDDKALINNFMQTTRVAALNNDEVPLRSKRNALNSNQNSPIPSTSPRSAKALANSTNKLRR